MLFHSSNETTSRFRFTRLVTFYRESNQFRVTITVIVYDNNNYEKERRTRSRFMKNNTSKNPSQCCLPARVSPHE